MLLVNDLSWKNHETTDKFCIMFTITSYMFLSYCHYHRYRIYTHCQPLEVVCPWIYENSNSNMIIISWLSQEAQYELSFGNCEILVCFAKYRCLEITSCKVFLADPSGYAV